MAPALNKRGLSNPTRMQRHFRWIRFWGVELDFLWKSTGFVTDFVKSEQVKGEGESVT